MRKPDSEVYNITKIDEALVKEGRATAAFLDNKITIEEYRNRLKETTPITQIDFRKLAADIYRHS